MYVLVIYVFVELPQKIPTHFNVEGQPDAFGSKGNLLIMLVVATLLFAVITLVSRKKNNYKTVNTLVANNRNQNEYIKTLFNFAKFLVTLSFLLVVTMIVSHSLPKYHSALNKSISVALIAIPIIAVIAVIVLFRGKFSSSSR